jgi:hypothetical protein
VPKSAKEKSLEKTKLLQDPVISAAFTHYFNRNWQAQQILNELQASGASVDYLREWALLSFHPLGADEAEEKHKRGLLVKSQLRKALIGYESAIACFSQYASAPNFDWPESKNMSKWFQDLVDMNKYLARETSHILEVAIASPVYTTKRLGVNWNIPYLYLSKIYIAKFTGWNDRRVLGAMTHLITAARKSVRNRVPSDLRSLVRKAIRTFESDPKNATIVGRLQRAVTDPNVLTKMFPPLITTAD